MSPAIIQLILTLVPLLIQEVPEAIAAWQQLQAMFTAGTPPTDAECAAMSAQFSADETVAQAAIEAAAGTVTGPVANSGGGPGEENPPPPPK